MEKNRQAGICPIHVLLSGLAMKDKIVKKVKRMISLVDPGDEKLDMAILIVNGKANYKDKLWLKICINRIIRYTSSDLNYKIFVWNHDKNNESVNEYLQSYPQLIEVLTIDDVNLAEMDLVIRPDDRKNSVWLFEGLYHVHSTPVQVLYDHFSKVYSFDKVFLFDNDAWPVRYNWDLIVSHVLDNGYELTGVWRDELDTIRIPYVHPSGLGIKTDTLKRLGLRFDNWFIGLTEDTISHITRVVDKDSGPLSIFQLKRSNAYNYHNVFSGIYGDLIYHHHLGTRYEAGKIKEAITAGWQDRGEAKQSNRFVLDSLTEMVFRDADQFILDLRYGNDSFEAKKYFNYLNNNYIEDRWQNLLDKSLNMAGRDPQKAYLLMSLLNKKFYFEDDFISAFIKVCEIIDRQVEADAYKKLMEKRKNH